MSKTNSDVIPWNIHSFLFKVCTITATGVPPNLLENPGGENGTLDPWVHGTPGVAVIDNGTQHLGYLPYCGSKHFFGGENVASIMSSTLTQTVNLLYKAQCFTEADLDKGTLRVSIRFYQLSLVDYIMIFEKIQGVNIDTARTSMIILYKSPMAEIRMTKMKLAHVQLKVLLYFR